MDPSRLRLLEVTKWANRVFLFDKCFHGTGATLSMGTVAVEYFSSCNKIGPFGEADAPCEDGIV